MTALGDASNQQPAKLKGVDAEKVDKKNESSQTLPKTWIRQVLGNFKGSRTESGTRKRFRYSPLDGQHSTRLVRVRQDGNFDIVPVNLADAPPYEAVSYVWGKPKLDHPMYIGDSEVLYITKNLYQALPRLRQHQKTGYLWIDQIVINQSDLAERGRQVKLMKDIYEGADRVLVWIGMAADTPDEFKSWLRHAGDISVSDALSEARANTIREHLAALPQICKAKFTEIMESPYITRAWVFQEAIVARQAEIVMGDIVVMFELMTWIISIFVNTYLGKKTSKDWQTKAANFTAVAAVKHSRKERGLRAYEVFSKFCSMGQCTEKCDQIYAFLGLVEDARITDTLEIDYGQSLEELFTNATKAIIRGTKSLDFLCTVARKESIDESRVPSWVPQWDWPAINLLYAEYTNQQDSRHEPSASKQRTYACEPKRSQVELPVRGRVVDHVKALVDVTSTIAVKRGTLRLSVERIASGHLPIDNIQEQLKNCTKIQFDRTRILRTLTANASWRDTVSIEEQEGIDFDDADAFLRAYDNTDKSDSTWQKSHESALFMLKVPALLRNILMTDSQLLGLVFKCEIGDQIAILHGCSYPVVLRHVEQNKYRVVDVCYLEGAMNGEKVTWNEDEADELILI
jgi:hypothetical protein